MSQNRLNHYVPEWFQRRFLLDGVTEKKFYYLDLDPETIVSNKYKVSVR